MSKKNKKKIIINWILIILLVVAGFFLLRFCTLDKDEFVERSVNDCMKNLGFSREFQHDLKRLGIDDRFEDHALYKNYCECTLKGSLAGLSDDDILRMQKMSAKERLELLGGEKVFKELNERCLVKYRDSLPDGKERAAKAAAQGELPQPIPQPPQAPTPPTSESDGNGGGDVNANGDVANVASGAEAAPQQATSTGGQ